jgi:hypothetical protein
MINNKSLKENSIEQSKEAGVVSNVHDDMVNQEIDLSEDIVSGKQMVAILVAMTVLTVSLSLLPILTSITAVAFHAVQITVLLSAVPILVPAIHKIG